MSKSIKIRRKDISKTLAKKFSKFGRDASTSKEIIISANLIAQLGKNFANDYNKLISGDELLKIAIDKLKYVEHDIGGNKIIYIECEDEEKFICFYSSHGFVEFGRRPLAKGENQYVKGKELIQMLRCSKGNLARLEKGLYNPSLKLAMDISKVFGVAVEEMFFIIEEEKK